MEGGGEKESRGEEPETSSGLGSVSRRGGGEACRQNGLINTHRLGAEPREVLLSVYSAPQYQGHVVVSTSPQQEHSRGPPQLLNPSALLPQHGVPDPRLRPAPGFFLCPESVLRAWGEAGGGDCCETTFIEGLGPEASSSSAAAVSTKEVLLFADGKYLEFSGEEAKIHTLSYDIDDDDDFQELEVNKLTSCSHTHTLMTSQSPSTDLLIGGWPTLPPEPRGGQRSEERVPGLFL